MPRWSQLELLARDGERGLSAPRRKLHGPLEPWNHSRSSSAPRSREQRHKMPADTFGFGSVGNSTFWFSSALGGWAGTGSAQEEERD